MFYAKWSILAVLFVVGRKLQEEKVACCKLSSQSEKIL